MDIKGKYNIAKIMVDDADYASLQQIKALCDMEILKDSKIRIMGDVCPAIATTVGSTFTYKERILPSLVSGDIGCGIITCKLKNKNIEVKQIDKIVREQIIERKKIDNIIDKYSNMINLKDLICSKYVDIDRCYNKLAELGGGNHFLEFDKDKDNNIWITVHSGSRLLGQQVYDFYIDKGFENIKKINTNYNRLYTYLEGQLMQDYLHDAEIVQRFADLNRRAIIDIIVKNIKNKIVDEYSSIHNYIDTKHQIVRKGAISALKDEKVVIPISASPIYGGVIIGYGLGNEEWNNSAPHGAGRICSRKEAKDMFTEHQYKKEMEGVYSSCINASTVDESPMVYKRLDYIKESLKDIVIIQEVLKPFYNYKSNNIIREVN